MRRRLRSITLAAFATCAPAGCSIDELTSLTPTDASAAGGFGGLAESSFGGSSTGGESGAAGGNPTGGASGGGGLAGSAGTAGSDSGTGGTVGVKPTDFPGLILWLRSDAGIEGTVSTWADQSGNSNDYSQTNPSFRPTLDSVGVNGHPLVHFDATGPAKSLQGKGLDYVSGLTLFLMFRSSTAPTTFYEFFDNAVASSGTRVGASGVAGFKDIFFGVGGHLFNGPANLDPNAHLIELLWDGSDPSVGAAYSLTFDGSPVAINKVTAPITLPPTSALGAYGGGGTSVLDGDLGEVVVYNRELQTSEQASLSASIRTFWGI